MKFDVEITEIGHEALVFLENPELNYIIIFDKTAPQDLKDIAVVHCGGNIALPIAVGDKVNLCGQSYTITAIGDTAENTLKELGHCTLSFSGDVNDMLPGQIMLDGDTLDTSNLIAGGKIQIGN